MSERTLSCIVAARGTSEQQKAVDEATNPSVPLGYLVGYMPGNPRLRIELYSHGTLICTVEMEPEDARKFANMILTRADLYKS